MPTNSKSVSLFPTSPTPIKLGVCENFIHMYWLILPPKHMSILSVLLSTCSLILAKDHQKWDTFAPFNTVYDHTKFETFGYTMTNQGDVCWGRLAAFKIWETHWKQKWIIHHLITSKTRSTFSSFKPIARHILTHSGLKWWELLNTVRDANP